jgi:hypothetical protein
VLGTPLVDGYDYSGFSHVVVPDTSLLTPPGTVPEPLTVLGVLAASGACAGYLRRRSA